MHEAFQSQRAASTWVPGFPKALKTPELIQNDALSSRMRQSAASLVLLESYFRYFLFAFQMIGLAAL
jgi:hypothetical protein